MTTRGASNAEQFHPEWLAALAESQGFLLAALDANRAGRYDQAQLRILEDRGRRILKHKLSPAVVLAGISIVGFLFTLAALSLPRPQVPGITTGPGAGILIMAVVISVVMLVIGLLLLRSGWRWWQHLKEDLKRNRIAVVEGFVVRSGPIFWTIWSRTQMRGPGRVRAQDLYCYIVQRSKISG